MAVDGEFGMVVVGSALAGAMAPLVRAVALRLLLSARPAESLRDAANALAVSTGPTRRARGRTARTVSAVRSPTQP